VETTLRKPSIWHRSLKNNVDRVLFACYRQNFVNIVLSLTYRKIVSINCFMLSDLQTKLCWHCFYFNLHTKLCHPYFINLKQCWQSFVYNMQTKLCQHCFSMTCVRSMVFSKLFPLIKLRTTNKWNIVESGIVYLWLCQIYLNCNYKYII
jgi:hypothetical protein